MNICHIIPSIEERRGGPSKSVRAVCAALSRQGNDVDLFATAEDSDTAISQTEGRMRTSIFKCDWPERLCPSAGMRNALATGTADVVHHHALWLRTLHYAHRSAKRNQSLFIISPRGMMSNWAWRHRRWRKRIARSFVHPGALEAADGWHVTSVEEEQEIRDLGFTQPVCIAPNAVDAPTEGGILADTAHWHALCPATANRPVALFYSRFHPKKRVIELIDAWLENAPPDWLLLLVGIPQDYTPETLERYARKASGGGRVAAFSGVGQPPPYGVASLFLLPSHNENFGLVVAEAMAHGVPVLVTDTTPWREVARRNLGWCVPWEEFPQALKAATAEGPIPLRERGTRARAWVLEEFSWDRSARRLLEFYTHLKESRRV